MPDRACLTPAVPLPALEAGLRIALALRRHARHAASLGDELLLFARRPGRRARPRPPGTGWLRLLWRLRGEAVDPGGHPAPAIIPALAAPATPSRVGQPAPSPERSAIPSSPALAQPMSMLALSIHWPATLRTQRTEHTVVLPGAILMPAQRIAAGPPAGAINFVRMHLFDRSPDVRLARTPPLGRSVPLAGTERSRSRGTGGPRHESGPVVRDAGHPVAGQLPRAPVTAERRRTESILPPARAVGSPSWGVEGLERVEVVLHTRDRVSASPGFTVAIYDRLTAEMASLRTVVEREVVTRTAPAKPVDDPVAPARDSSLTMFENDQALIMLSRRMRSLAQEERFRLGRLR